MLSVALKSGGKMPLVGLGTWKSKDIELINAIKHSIKIGYRHFDCASDYCNEEVVGDALKECFDEKMVSREDLFLVSKLNQPYHRREHVKPILMKTLKDLNVDYLDLWLMHWPVAFKYVPYDANKRGFPEDYDAWSTGVDYDCSIRETWEAMEACVQDGLVKAIGVSNFSIMALHDLLSWAKIKPDVNQVELHPYHSWEGLVKYCHKRDVLPVAYSPLGCRDGKEKDDPDVLSDPVINRIADEKKKTAAQVVLRWAVQRNTVVIPKSVTPKYIQENFEIQDFKLSDEEMIAISSLNRDHRFSRCWEWDAFEGINVFS